MKNRKSFMKFLMMMFAGPMILIFGALSTNTNVDIKEGTFRSYPVKDNVHIYKGALVCVDSTGYALPAADTSGYTFVGIAVAEADNTVTGHSTGLINVRTEMPNFALLSGSGFTQASVGVTVYATADDTVAVSSSNNIVCGKISAYVSATSVWVRLNDGTAITALNVDVSPFSNMTTKVDNYSVLAGDSGTTFAIATDAKVFSLPATVAGLTYTFVNTGADGAVLLSVSPVAADGISGGGLATGVVNKDLLNTKATAKKYDFVTIVGTGVTGAGAWVITRKYGVWAAEG